MSSDKRPHREFNSFTEAKEAVKNGHQLTVQEFVGTLVKNSKKGGGRNS